MAIALLILTAEPKEGLWLEGIIYQPWIKIFYCKSITDIYMYAEHPNKDIFSRKSQILIKNLAMQTRNFKEPFEGM